MITSCPFCKNALFYKNNCYYCNRCFDGKSYIDWFIIEDNKLFKIVVDVNDAHYVLSFSMNFLHLKLVNGCDFIYFRHPYDNSHFILDDTLYDQCYKLVQSLLKLQAFS